MSERVYLAKSLEEYVLPILQEAFRNGTVRDAEKEVAAVQHAMQIVVKTVEFLRAEQASVQRFMNHEP